MHPEALAHHQAGLAYQQQGHLEAAALEFEQALALDPRLDLTRELLAAVRHQMGDHALAIGHYRHLLEAQPDNLKILFNLGASCCAAGELGQAEAAFARCHRLDPRFAPALSSLAWIYQQQGNQGAAAASLNLLLQLDPGDDAATYQLALLLRDQARDAEAIRILGDLVRDRQPDHLAGRLLLAELLAGRDPEAAWQQLAEIWALAPGFVGSRELGTQLAYRSLEGAVDRGDARAEAAWLERVLSLGPRDPAAIRRLADLLAEQERAAKALALYLELLKADPADEDVTLAAAGCLKKLGKRAEAENLLGRLLAAHPDHRDALVLRAELLVDMGRADQAGGVLERVLELDPSDMSARVAQAQALAAAGREDEAYASMRELVESAPMDFDLRKEAAALCRKTASYHQQVEGSTEATDPRSEASRKRAGDLAVVWWERYLEFEPFDAKVLETLGNLHRQRESWANAARIYERLASVRPEPAVWHILGTCQMALGDPAGAATAFQTALDRAVTGRWATPGPGGKDPTIPTRMALAEAHEAAGDLAQALDAAIGVLDREPEHSIAGPMARRIATAFALEAQESGRHAEAADFWRIVGQAGNDRETLDNLAGALDRAGDAPGAMSAYQALLDDRPGDRRILLRLGELSLALARPDDARRWFQELNAVDPQNVRALVALAELASSSGDRDAAYDLYEKVIALDPSHVEGVLTFARQARDAGHLTEAWEYARRILAQQPKHPEAEAIADHALRELARTSEPDQAVAWWQTLAMLRPEDLEAIRGLWTCYRKLGANVEAAAAAQRLLAVEPLDVEAALFAAEQERRSGNLEAARAALRPAAAAGDTGALLELSALERSAANWTAVRETLTRLAAERPDDPEAVEGLAEADLAEGRPESAWTALEPLLTADKATAFGRKIAGEAARAMARRSTGSEALGWWSRVGSALGPDTEALRSLVALHVERGDRDEAARMARIMLDRFNESEAAIFLAHYHADRQEWPEVSEALSKVADDPEAAFLLAKIAWRDDDLAGARRHLATLRRLIPRHRDAARLLAQVAVAEGAIEEAWSAYQEVLALGPDEEATKAVVTLCRQAVDISAQNFESQASWLHRLVSVTPEDAEAWLALATALTRARMHGDAAAAYHKLGELQPKEPRWPAREGDCLLLAGHPKEAAAALSRAHELAPTDPGVTLAIAQLAEQSERYDQAYLAAASLLSDGRPAPVDPKIVAGARRIAIHASLRLAEQARIAGSLEAMAMNLERACGLDPENLAMWRALGDACKMNGDLEGAARAYERMAALEPDNLEFAFVAGDAYRIAGNLTEARRIFLAILEREVDHLPTLLVLGGMLWQDRDLAGARWYLKRILASLDASSDEASADPEGPPTDPAAVQVRFERQVASGRMPSPREARIRVSLMLSGLAIEEGNFEEARSRARQVAELAGEGTLEFEQARRLQIQALGGLGGVAQAAGDLQSARKIWTEAAHLAPEDRLSFRKLAALEAAEGRPAEAARMFQILWETDGSDIEAAQALAGVLLQMGEGTRARKVLEDAAQVEEGPEAAIGVAEIALASSDLDGAWHWVQVGFERDPSYSRAHDCACDVALALASRARDAGNVDEERRWWEQLAELAPTGRDRVLELARGQLRMQAPAVAAANLVRLWEVSPGDPEVALELAQTLEAAGDLEGAVLNYRRVILGAQGLDDGDAEGIGQAIKEALSGQEVVTGHAPIREQEKALLQLARLSSELGRPEEAWEWSQALLSIRPDHADARDLAATSAEGLAEAAEREGDLDSALLYRQVYLAMRPQDRQGTLGLASVHLAAGRRAEAMALYRDLLARHPDETDVRLALADAMLPVDRVEARRHYQEALEIQPRNARAIASLAQMAVAEGDPARAFGLFGQAAAAADDPAPYWLAQAELAWQTDRAFEAWNLVGEILARDPGHPRAVQMAIASCRKLADQAQRRGQIDTEREYWEALLEAIPDSTVALRELGRMARQAMDFEAAEDHLRRALEQDPADHAAAHERGLLLLDRGYPEAARKTFVGILEADPRNCRTLLTIAELDWEEGDPDGAWYHVQALLALEPANWAGLALFCKLARKFAERSESRGDLKSAVEWWQLAVKQAPREGSYLRGLAEARAKAGDLQGAAGSFSRLMELAPDDLEAAHRAADVFRQMGDANRAEAALRRVVALDPRHAPSLRLLLKLARERNEAPDVLRWAYDLLDLEPHDTEALFVMAWAHNALLEKKAALVTYEELLKQQPKHAESWHQAAILHRDLGDLEAAKKAATNAVVCGPKPDRHVTLGTIYARMGLWDEAIAAFGQALVLQPENSEALAHLGFGLLQVRRNDQAKIHLERAMLLVPRGDDLALSIRCALDRI